MPITDPIKTLNLKKQPLKLKAQNNLKESSQKLKNSAMANINQKLKSWTILIYMQGNNELGLSMLEKLRQLEEAGSNQEINILAQISKPKQIGNFNEDNLEAKRLYIIKGPKSYIAQSYSQELENLGCKDHSNPQTLTDFINYGIKNFPAKHYLIILHNHGDAWLGGWRDNRTNQILTLPELKEAFNKAEIQTNLKPDIIAMDACLMANMETAYQLKDNADILLASEEMEYSYYGTGNITAPLDKILNKISNKTLQGEISPKELAKIWVEECKNARSTPTQSAIDLSKIEETAKALNQLAENLLKTDTSLEILREIIYKTQHFSVNEKIKPFIYQKDLYDFVQKIYIHPNIKDEKLKKSAKKLIVELNKAIIASKNQTDFTPNAYGISIYLPTSIEGAEKPKELLEKATCQKIKEDIYYKDLDLAKNTLWDEFFNKIAKTFPEEQELKNIPPAHLPDFGIDKEEIDINMYRIQK